MIRIFSLYIIIFLLINSATGQTIQTSDSIKEVAIWKRISPYFSPPSKYKGKYGHYRSPLICYNGDTVETPLQWEKRRKEILTQWNKMMGEWPPLLKDQHFTLLDSVHRDGFMQYRVQFCWVPDQQTKGYLLIPDNIRGRKPAVITVYYEPETAIGWGKLPHRDFAYQLTKRGFITLSLGTTKTTKNKTYSLYYPGIDSAEIQPLSLLAYAAANAWYALSKVPVVDSNRIGIMGHSYGGKWAMFASCLFDKFAAAVWSDPGIVFDETKGSLINYWAPWYLGYYPPPWTSTWRKKGMVKEAKGLYPKLIKNGYDLQELHALMAPRPFLVSGGESDQQDRWIPLNWSIEVNKLLGYRNRVAMTNRNTHAPTKSSNEIAYLFFEYFLKLDDLKDGYIGTKK